MKTTVFPCRWGTSRLIVGLLGLCLGFGVVGCGGNSKIPIYPVRGEVLHQGEPAEGALVIFHPLDQTKDVGEKVPPRPSGLVAADGSFALTTHTPGDGARAGDYQVSIVWFDEVDSDSGGGIGQRDSEHGPRAKDRLNGTFADPKHSGLKATITSGVNALEPFDLK